MSGRLFYVMGPSGAGKDSLLKAVKPLLCGLPVAFVRRYITRSSDKGEWHIPVSRTRFARMEEEGAFALTWYSHGCSYGIAGSTDLALAHGIFLVVNGSREALPRAVQHYPNLVPFLIDVDPSVLRSRIEGRGRESGKDIEERLQRAFMPLPPVPGMMPCLHIDNSGSLEDAALHMARLMQHFMQETGLKEPALPRRIVPGRVI